MLAPKMLVHSQCHAYLYNQGIDPYADITTTSLMLCETLKLPGPRAATTQESCARASKCIIQYSQVGVAKPWPLCLIVCITLTRMWDTVSQTNCQSFSCLHAFAEAAESFQVNWDSCSVCVYASQDSCCTHRPHMHTFVRKDKIKYEAIILTRGILVLIRDTP